MGMGGDRDKDILSPFSVNKAGKGGVIPERDAGGRCFKR